MEKEFLFSLMEASEEAHAGFQPKYAIINGRIQQYTRVLNTSKEVEAFVEKDEYYEYEILGKGKELGRGPLKKNIKVIVTPRRNSIVFNKTVMVGDNSFNYKYSRSYDPNTGLLNRRVPVEAWKAMQDVNNISINHA